MQTYRGGYEGLILSNLYTSLVVLFVIGATLLIQFH